MSNDLANSKTQLTIRDHLKSDQFKEEVAAALPKHLTADRMVRIALTAMTKTPKLAQCDKPSFFQALLTLSSLGLEPDGRHAHLIPFNNNKTGKVECQLIIDYKGLVELAYRSGMVKSIHCDVIREGDVFEYDRGEVKKHIPWAWRADKKQHLQGEIIGAYAIVTMESASKHEVMSREEIDSIKKRSRSGSSGPWVTDYPEMAKKTVFRRASKWIPLSSEIRDAYDKDDDRLTFEATPKVLSSESFADVFTQSNEAELPVAEDDKRSSVL